MGAVGGGDVRRQSQGVALTGCQGGQGQDTEAVLRGVVAQVDGYRARFGLQGDGPDGERLGVYGFGEVQDHLVGVGDEEGPAEGQGLAGGEGNPE